MTMGRAIGPADYFDHRALATEGLNLWENHGWMVWDRTAGEDVLLWLSPYRVIGGQADGPFLPGDAALSQTLVLRGRFVGEERLTLNDTPFLAVGYDLGDRLPGDALQVTIGDEAVWQIQGREFRAAPPRWSIRGLHAGVDVELELTAMGPPFWLADPARPIEESQEHWFVQCARARGRVVHRGSELLIDGYASHERHVHYGTRYDPPRLLAGSGVTWHSGSGDGVQVIALSRPSLNRSWARVVFDEGAVAEFRAPTSDCRIDEVGHWTDPQTRLRVPNAWRGEFTGTAGRLEVEATAFARAYYLWSNFRHGATVLYWWLADARVRYELADGRSGDAAFQYIVHDNRLLYRQHVDD